MKHPSQNGAAPPSLPALEIGDTPKGTVSRFFIDMVESGTGQPLSVPVIVARGKKPGPVVGITAAVHGNELNGIPVIGRLFQEIRVEHLSGTIIGVPAVNLPGFLSGRREFSDGADLNRQFPGKPVGTCAQVYAYRFMERVARRFEYLIDLHTANFGRVNSLYVRADMTDKVPAWMARLQQPQIIVHKHGSDGTLRGAVAALGIPAITVEVGNPQLFQQGLIKSSLSGVHNVLGHLNMLPLNEEPPAKEPVICTRSRWLFTDAGGLLEVYPQVADFVKKGDLIAKLTDIFGDVLREYRAPENAVVIGKNVNPVAQTGTRIVHLGVVGRVEKAQKKK
jgi:predicted deacylase